jgi:2,3-bisphosphoglycerate-independent phosphoglycerate mutase
LTLPAQESISVKVLFLFVDGVGVGPDDPASNPLAAAELPALTDLLGGRPVASTPAANGATVPPSPHFAPPLPFASLDARLGVDGLPQSGTGQTALLTGINAPALLGRHDGPYPHSDLKAILGRSSLWFGAQDAGLRVALANAYPDRYLERAHDGRGRMGAIARSALLAGVRLRGPEDLRRGRGISAFLTNSGWRDHLGYRDLPEITPADAGRNLAALAQDHDFTLFEYYATDLAGHRPDRWSATGVLEAFDGFLKGVLAHWPSHDVLVLASDHGNIEDQGTRRHTLNPALGAWRGPAPDRPLTALTDVAPAVLAALGLSRDGRSSG